jgi:hypothetical protein
MRDRSKDDDGSAPGLESRYDDALLSANWNPVIDLLGALSDAAREVFGRDPAPKAAQEDPEDFLNRYYKLGN